ncbi:hypothetical protein EDB83DRAFT_2318697 [Lactarius deliciosus]|nr:hypothetical protein EDB83DRAFT_2318697 [Lactarius deliciosus]
MHVSWPKSRCSESPTSLRTPAGHLQIFRRKAQDYNEVQVGDGPIGLTEGLLACSCSHIDTSPPEMLASKLYYHPPCVAQTRVLSHMLVSPSNEDASVPLGSWAAYPTRLIASIQVQLRTPMRPSYHVLVFALDAHHAPIQLDDSLLPYTSALSPSPCASAGQGPPALPRAPPRPTCGMDGDHDRVPQQSALPLPVYNAPSAGTANLPPRRQEVAEGEDGHAFREERFLGALCQRHFQSGTVARIPCLLVPPVNTPRSPGRDTAYHCNLIHIHPLDPASQATNTRADITESALLVKPLARSRVEVLDAVPRKLRRVAPPLNQSDILRWDGAYVTFKRARGSVVLYVDGGSVLSTPCQHISTITYGLLQLHNLVQLSKIGIDRCFPDIL